MKQGGAWLAFSKSGKFAALTNYPLIDRQVADSISRGFLIADYLDSEISTIDYVSSLRYRRDQFEGFHLQGGRIRPKIELIM